MNEVSYIFVDFDEVSSLYIHSLFFITMCGELYTC